MQRISLRRLLSSGSQHRKYMRRDAERLRFVSDGGFVGSNDNPGIRIEPSFVSELQAAALVADSREASEAYGYSYSGDRRVHTVDADGAVSSETLDLVNNLRVTGRPERPDRPPAPWGYGANFDESFIFGTSFGALADRIRSCGAYKLGPLRDITVNQRSHSFFQLDPHLDPPEDGPDVFILSLLSSAVLTFSPTATTAERLGVEKRSGKDVGLRSWTDADIDALAEPRTLIHFGGAARGDWNHAIRAGVEVDQNGEAAICDWWGQSDYLLRRGKERISIVLAFGQP